MKRHLLLSVLLLVFSVTSFAGHEMRNIEIRVQLQDNGDAIITEYRNMWIGSEGTECFIVIGNLGSSQLKDFQVYMVTGEPFKNEGWNWDVDRSREQKAWKCGIVDKGNKYELCWGVGNSGIHTYVVKYTITKVVKGYNDYDGFNFMWVAEKIDPAPQHVRVTIEHADTTKYFTPEDTRVWGFRYKGNINVIDGKVVAETSERFSSSSALITMVQFNKGIFNPSDTYPGSFEETVKQKALEGSDYVDSEGKVRPTNLYGSSDDSGGTSVLGAILAFLFGTEAGWVIMIVGGIIGWFALDTYVFTPIRKKKLRKKLLGDELQTPWFRDIPIQGNLHRSQNILKELTTNTYTKEDLMAAHVLRLIYQGMITVIPQRDQKGNWTKMFYITPPTEHISRTGFGIHRTDRNLHIQIHDLLYNAAGMDHILQKGELNDYMEHYAVELREFLNSLKIGIQKSSITPEEAKHVYGFDKFLREFSLSNERHVEEVGLWKEYLVFATAFGIGDQVRKDMKKMCPDYLNMDTIARDMLDNTETGILIGSLLSDCHRGTRYVETYKTPEEIAAERERSSGGGGSSSFGGGGGFSGGGSGGGVR